jgi:hypothetical protein
MVSRRARHGSFGDRVGTFSRMRSVRVAVALALPLMVLAVLAQQRGATAVTALLFVAAIGTLVALEILSRGSRSR